MGTITPAFPVQQSVLYEHILECTGACAISSTQTVQTLWSGYGKIIRCHLTYSDSKQRPAAPTVIVKFIQPPVQSNHPRGWNTDASQQRKLESYRVETFWYEQYAKNSIALCAMPRLYASQTTDTETWLILEDLDPAFPLRKTSLSADDCKPCLRWLARFHAYHLESAGDGLWPIGTYWHLQTRQDEFRAMPNSELKTAAYRLDEKLNNCHHQTLVHGDAKLANFCFSAEPDNVAMVDFQYTGRGCGIRDIAYFLGSCLSEDEFERSEAPLLNTYYKELNQHLPDRIKEPLEREWRALYPTAWADFHRFLAGWMPEHQKINRYTRSMTQRALAQL